MKNQMKLFAALALAVAAPVAAAAQSLVPLESVATGPREAAPQSAPRGNPSAAPDTAETAVPAEALDTDTGSADDAGEIVDASVLERWNEDRTQFFDAEEVTLDELVWTARPVVVFANSPNDPQFQRQVELLESRIAALADRDVIVVLDTDPANPSPARQDLRPRGFMLVLVAKDGNVALRRPVPLDVRELSSSIDKMPDRQQEVRDRRSAGQ